MRKKNPILALAAGRAVVHGVDEDQVVRVDGDADFFAGLADGAVDD